MEVTFHKKSNTLGTLKVSLAPSDYQTAIEAKIKKHSKTANIKGFRPGKVPVSVIKRMFGHDILVEEVQNTLFAEIEKYLKESPLNLVGDPLPSDEPDEKKENIWEEGHEFEFFYTLGFASDFELSLQEISVKKYSIHIADQEVDKTIQDLQERNASQQEIETSLSKEDFVYGKISQLEGDFTSEYAVIPIARIKETEQSRFIGLKVEEVVQFRIEDVFENPEDVKYFLGVFEEGKLEELRTAELSFTVTQIQTRIPAELNEEFFKKLFPSEEITDLEAFREKVRGLIADNYNREAGNLLNAQIQDQLTRQTSFELPHDFMKRWLLVANQGKVTKEQIEQEYAKIEADTRWSIIQKKLVEQLNVSVENKEVENRAQELLIAQMKQYGFYSPEALANVESMSRKMLLENNGKQFRDIYNVLVSEKVFEKIKETVSLQEEQVSKEDFEKIIKDFNEEYAHRYGLEHEHHDHEHQH